MWKKPPIRHILIVQTAKIGDMVCTTPVIHALKKSYPQAKLSVMAISMTVPLLKANPDVDHIVTVKMSDFKGLKGRWRLLTLLRQQAVDTILFLNPNLSFLLMSFWCGIARRLAVLPFFMGNTFLLAKRLMTHIEIQQEGELIHQVQQRLLKQINVDMLSFQRRAYAAASAPIVLDTKVKWLGLGVSAGNKLKEIGAEKLLALIEKIVAKTEMSIALIGALDDAPLAQQLLQQISQPERMIDTTGQIALEALPDFLRHLSLYVGVDSGITHLADAAGVPIVSIVGPADPREQRPMGRDVHIIQQKEPCAPCVFIFKTPYYCRVGTRACIEKVSAEMIFAQIQLLLKKIEKNKALS
jgi:lipopolysaccharide heptosyltransferase II